MSLASTVRNHAIGIGFKGAARFARLQRDVSRLGKPRLGNVDHVTIPVPDLDRAKEFYCDVLGGACFMTIDDAALARFHRPPAPNDGEGAHHHSVYFGGSTRVDLFLQHSGQAQPTHGHPHLAFGSTPADMLRWKRLLESRGVPVDGPVRLGPPGQASMYFNDPFGNHIEITCFGFSQPIEIRAPEMARLVWRDPAA